MQRFKYALYRFMYGRYGSDTLNITILITGFLLSLCNSLWFGNTFLPWVSFLLYFLCIYRMYSKKITQRRKENTKFLSFFRPLTRRINLYKKQKIDPSHRYFICPCCKQSIRVPRGRGKIEITCPSCKQKFIKKS
ncbi:MAG: hypothetical protein ACK5KR_03460 [Breznakia sp.]